MKFWNFNTVARLDRRFDGTLNSVNYFVMSPISEIAEIESRVSNLFYMFGVWIVSSFKADLGLRGLFSGVKIFSGNHMTGARFRFSDNSNLSILTQNWDDFSVIFYLYHYVFGPKVRIESFTGGDERLEEIGPYSLELGCGVIPYFFVYGGNVLISITDLDMFFMPVFKFMFKEANLVQVASNFYLVGALGTLLVLIKFLMVYARAFFKGFRWVNKVYG